MFPIVLGLTAGGIKSLRARTSARLAGWQNGEFGEGKEARVGNLLIQNASISL
jgi:hypothetical protein